MLNRTSPNAQIDHESSIRNGSLEIGAYRTLIPPHRRPLRDDEELCDLITEFGSEALKCVCWLSFFLFFSFFLSLSLCDVYLCLHLYARICVIIQHDKEMDEKEMDWT